MNLHVVDTAQCRLMHPTWRSAVALALILGLASNVLAIKPGRWVHTTEADFEPGQTENTVVTNRGQVKLGTASTVIGQIPEEAGIVHDLVLVKDVLYVAVGPEAILLRRNGDQFDQVLSLKGEQIFSLAPYDDKLLIGISGAKCRLAMLDGNTLTDLHLFDDEVRYIWDLLVLDGSKRVAVATGTDGKVLQVDLAADQPEAKTLLDCAQTNVLCLGTDARGYLYAGTDTEGLVYRVALSGQQFEAFVVYDAPEPEIAALLVNADGTVYAGTADAEQAKPGRLKKAASEQTGRPQIQQEPDNEPEPSPDCPPSESNDQPQDAGKEEADKPQSLDASPAPQDAGDTQAEQLPSVESTQQLSAPTRLQEDQPPDLDEHIASDADKPPTHEQRDALRAVIRAQLKKARKTGELQTPTPTGTRAKPNTARTSGRPPARRAAEKGNAIYRIDPDGFTHEIFRESVMILSIFPDQEMLLIGTGNEGQLYLVDPVAEETSILLNLEPQQIPTLVLGNDQRILAGTANPPSLVQLDRGFSQTGTYTSQTLDAAQISLWGKIHLTAQVNPGSTVTIQTRSGNVEDPEEAAWSKWSEPVALGYDENIPDLEPREVAVNSPPARFLQYRLTLTSEYGDTAKVDQVELAYVVPNLKPVVQSVKAGYGKQPGKRPSRTPRPGRPGSSASNDDIPQQQTVLKLEWEAMDPNGDLLLYRLEYRPAESDQWLPMAEDLTENKYEWNTQLSPDGRYVVRVTAFDDADNTPDMAKSTFRHTDPVMIDNTPPVFDLMEHAVDQATITLTVRVSDSLSHVDGVDYSVDGTNIWRPLLAEDLILDSTVEALTGKIPDLAKGPHTITLRAIDAAGNARYESQFIEIE